MTNVNIDKAEAHLLKAIDAFYEGEEPSEEEQNDRENLAYCCEMLRNSSKKRERGAALRGLREIAESILFTVTDRLISEDAAEVSRAEPMAMDLYKAKAHVQHLNSEERRYD